MQRIFKFKRDNPPYWCEFNDSEKLEIAEKACAVLNGEEGEFQFQCLEAGKVKLDGLEPMDRQIPTWMWNEKWKIDAINKWVTTKISFRIQHDTYQREHLSDRIQWSTTETTHERIDARFWNPFMERRFQYKHKMPTFVSSSVKGKILDFVGKKWPQWQLDRKNDNRQEKLRKKQLEKERKEQEKKRKEQQKEQEKKRKEQQRLIKKQKAEEKAQKKKAEKDAKALKRENEKARKAQENAKKKEDARANKCKKIKRRLAQASLPLDLQSEIYQLQHFPATQSLPATQSIQGTSSRLAELPAIAVGSLVAGFVFYKAVNFWRSLKQTTNEETDIEAGQARI